MTTFTNAKLINAPDKNVCFHCLDGEVWAHLNVIWAQSHYVYDFSKLFNEKKIINFTKFPYQSDIVQKCVDAFYNFYEKLEYGPPNPLYIPKMYDVFDYLLAKPYFVDIINNYSYENNKNNSDLFNLRKEISDLTQLFNCFEPILPKKIKFLGKRKFEQCIKYINSKRNSYEFVINSKRNFYESVITTIYKLFDRRLNTILYGSRSAEQYNKLIKEFTYFIYNLPQINKNLISIMDNRATKYKIAPYGLIIDEDITQNKTPFELIGTIITHTNDYYLTKLNVPADVPIEFFGNNTYYKLKEDDIYKIELYKKKYDWISTTIV